MEKIALIVVAVTVAATGVFALRASAPEATQKQSAKAYAVTHTDSEWKKRLTPNQYHILREAGTESPYHNEFCDNHAKGIYLCAGCDNELFSSDTKFESGTGWPSFFRPLNSKAVQNIRDSSFGMSRTEVVCARCGGHLGHVFNDGPAPTGLRYCMNSGAMVFHPAKK